MRTQEAIIERIHAVADTDFLGFEREVLIAALDFEHAREFLLPEVTADEWREDHLADDEIICKEAADYMAFAWGKVEDHRGISAGRSVCKMRSFVWLLGDDALLERFDAAPYAQYGAPQLRVICEEYHWPIPESESVRRMTEGLQCRGPNDPYAPCMEGCS
jgi:hypothetical protein